MLKTVLVLALAASSGCGSKETAPAGPLGGVHDLRSKLQPAVAAKAPADDKATRHELAADLHGAKATLVWRTFEDAGNQWIVSYQWEVTAPASSITLEPLGDMPPINRGSETAVNESVVVRIRWHDNSSSGTHLGDLSFQIAGDGTGSPI
jgi:hypothetical protein